MTIGDILLHWGSDVYGGHNKGFLKSIYLDQLNFNLTLFNNKFKTRKRKRKCSREFNFTNIIEPIFI